MLIENADPGFDFIFAQYQWTNYSVWWSKFPYGYKMYGKYIPAAIGVGEKN